MASFDPNTDGYSYLKQDGSFWTYDPSTGTTEVRTGVQVQDDGQFYAQLAVAGNPFEPAVAVALDSPGYRARRILFPALVHLAGLGQPARILQIYALANLLCLLRKAHCIKRS